MFKEKAKKKKDNERDMRTVVLFWGRFNWYINVEWSPTS